MPFHPWNPAPFEIVPGPLSGSDGLHFPLHTSFSVHRITYDLELPQFWPCGPDIWTSSELPSACLTGLSADTTVCYNSSHLLRSGIIHSTQTTVSFISSWLRCQSRCMMRTLRRAVAPTTRALLISALAVSLGRSNTAVMFWFLMRALIPVVYGEKNLRTRAKTIIIDSRCWCSTAYLRSLSLPKLIGSKERSGAWCQSNRQSKGPPGYKRRTLWRKTLYCINFSEQDW